MQECSECGSHRAGAPVSAGKGTTGAGMDIEGAYKLIDEEMARIERFLFATVGEGSGAIPEVGAYIIRAGGKRLRPALAVLSARLCGYDGADLVPYAAIFELIHSATLLHDDVVDGARIRRGRPSVNTIWSGRVSVVAADHMIAQVFGILTEREDLRTLGLVTSAITRMVTGEILQLGNAGNTEVEESVYLDAVVSKTAVLMTAACRTGAILAGAPERLETALAAYGERLGIAFQIVDDMLDYSAGTETFGKENGQDLREGKVTLPLIAALRKAGPEARAPVESIIRSGGTGERDVETVIAFIERFGGMERARTLAEQYRDRAIEALAPFPHRPERDALAALARFTLARSF